MNHRTRAVLLRTLGGISVIAAASASLVLARVTPTLPAPVTTPALPVETLPVHMQDGFELVRTFAGRAQARRASPLGFESGGRLVRVYVDEGSAVEPGALLAEIDTERLQARRAELAAALAESAANLDLANATLRRLRGVVEQGGVSRQGLDEARERERAARAAVELATQRIASLEVELDKSRLLAPFAGTIVARLVDEGRVLDTGEPVLRLQERSPPEIRIGVAGRAIEQLEPGRRYQLEWRDRRLAASLRVVLPLRAATARTVDALFDLDDPAPAMLPGDIVTLRLTTRIDEPGAWLPLSALAEGEQSLWSLYVVDPDADPPDGLGANHRVQRRSVDVVHQDADRVYVRGALNPHDRIVSTGLQRIVPGQWVRAAEARIALQAYDHD